MTKWPSLDPAQQNELLGEMTTMVVARQPPGWRQVMINYRHLGRVTDAEVGVRDANGTYQLFDPPVEVWRMFQRLRGGMYREGEGTWFSVSLTVEPPSRFSVVYNWREKPGFPSWPAPDEFALELKRFPRGEAHLPSWFRESLDA
jgi:hypothetical protein